VNVSKTAQDIEAGCCYLSIVESSTTSYTNSLQVNGKSAVTVNKTKSVVQLKDLDKVNQVLVAGATEIVNNIPFSDQDSLFDKIHLVLLTPSQSDPF
jgi:hypothetical protein